MGQLNPGVIQAPDIIAPEEPAEYIELPAPPPLPPPPTLCVQSHTRRNPTIRKRLIAAIERMAYKARGLVGSKPAVDCQWRFRDDPE